MCVLSSNFKYTFEKNKTKILVGTSIVLFAGIGVGTYFVLNDYHFGVFGKVQQESHLAKYIVSGSKNGSLSIIDTESGESKDSVTLPSGNYVYSLNDGYDTLYAYNGKTVQAYELKDGKFKELGQTAKVKVDGATAIRVDGSNVAVLSNNGQTLTYHYKDGTKEKTKVIELQDNVDDFRISKGILTYSTNTTLHSFSPSSDKSIDLGESTDAITNFQDQLLIHNKFGSGLDNSILVSLNNKNLKVTGLKETKSAETNLLPMDSDDDVFYTTQYVSSEEPYHLLDKWKIQDGRIVKDEDVTVKIPVKKDGIVYDKETSVASDSYLYTHFKNRMQIFDIRSHEVLKNISVEEYFAMPILVK